MIPELKSCWLDHVAVAVEDIERSVQIFSALGLKFSDEREVVSDQKVITAFAPLDSRAHLELLQTTDTTGPIGKFIATKGAGIHHLCFRVPHLAELMAKLQAQGMQFLYAAPKAGAGGKMVNFIHPKSTGGVLIELSQESQEQGL